MKQGQIRSLPVNFRYLRGVDIFLTAIEFIWNSWFQNYRLWTSVWYNFSFEEIKKSSSNGSLNSWLLLKPFEWDINWDTVRSQFKLKIQLRQFKRKKNRIPKVILNEKREFGVIFWVKTYSCEQKLHFQLISGNFRMKTMQFDLFRLFFGYFQFFC